MLNKSSLSLAVASALLISGCSLAPDFLRPAAPVANEWNASVNVSPDGKRNIDNTPWQAFFPDPRLQALINSAFEYNRDMRIAIARVEEARALYGVQRADRLPGLNITGSQTAARTPASVSTTGSTLRTRRYDAGLSVSSFELDFWGRVANLSDAALSNYLATEEAQRSFRLSLMADVANAYFTVLEMEDRAAVAEETVKSRSEGRDILAKRREVGIAGDLDFLQADGALELAKADLANLERQRAAAVNALVLLVGQPALAKDLPAGKRLTEQDVVADLNVSVPSEVLLKRPDVLAAELKLKAANANIGAARAAFLPKILLSASVGSAAPLMSGLFDSGNGAWSFTPSLSMPLFDWGRTSNNLDVAEARKVIAVAEYEKAIQQAFREVVDLLVAREQLAKQLTALEAAEKAQTERLRLADARYKGGIANYLDVLDAQREAYSAQQSTIQARRLLLSTAANLYKALGGAEVSTPAQ
ncbi:MAG TPA: efflux transporter outer membrane subunit [Rhodocyclaceae bacterium]|jgi:multidrug efflux system outer membrane protein|nr:efflux transporter outer membrane subunit [Rhodocyclaceae bacterium]